MYPSALATSKVKKEISALESLRELHNTYIELIKEQKDTGVNGCNVIWAYTSSVSTSAWKLTHTPVHWVYSKCRQSYLIHN